MLKPGYKQTDIGVLPEEWEVQPLGDSLTRKPDYGINAAAVPYSSILPVYLRITDISEEGSFLSHNKTSVYHSAARAFILQENDIVFARTGASTGKSYLYDPNDGELVFAGFLIRVQTNQSKLDARFLKAFVQTAPYWKWVATTSVRSGQPGINGVEYAQLQIPLPPLAEQQAIADTLGAVDALLREQRALLAKKRDLKRATQTALLTRARRLPGFSGEWHERTLGDVLKIKHGKTQHTVIDSNGKYPILATGGEIGRASEFLFDKPSVLIGRKGTIDFPQYMDSPFWTIDTLFYTELLGQNLAKYFFYVFQTID